ncbi:MAG TPA: hypothetical protein VGX78_04235 [Pirellulales bacterium]|jgi:hypothetical protein|nr:hypothetical protein [Pirellulales bacterium]
MGTLVLTIQPGQRWMAVVLGLPQPVQVIEPSYVSPHQWMCLLESSGEHVALDEQLLEELLPELEANAAPAPESIPVQIPPIGL